MLIAQISDTHVKAPGRLAYRKVDTAAMLRRCIAALADLDPQPDLVVLTGDLVDLGQPEEYAYLREMLSLLRPELLIIPGNHDDRDELRRAFADHDYLPRNGFLHYAVERGPLRVVGLDTLVPGAGGGELCPERLAWLDATLAAGANIPTLVTMHHPPFKTGIAHMDHIGLEGSSGFAAIIARHPQVDAILCGHVHRSVHARVGGKPAMICPSPAHQVALDLTPNGASAFRLEPPGYMLHRWHEGTLTSHVAVLGDWPGPFPFFDADGRLID